MQSAENITTKFTDQSINELMMHVGGGATGPELRRKSNKHKWFAWLGQATAGWGKTGVSLARKSRKVWPTIGLHWPRLAGPKIGQDCQETLTSLAKNIITGHAYLFRVYLEWSVF